LCLAWVPSDVESRPAVIGRVGDATCFRAFREVEATHPFAGVFARDDGPINEVRAALPVPASRSIAAEVKSVDLSDVEYLVLLTDGVAIDLYGCEDVRLWLADCWAGAPSAELALRALLYKRQGSHDDRTAIVVKPSVAVTS
jgi:hypothetical protein